VSAPSLEVSPGRVARSAAGIGQYPPEGRRGGAARDGFRTAADKAITDTGKHFAVTFGHDASPIDSDEGDPEQPKASMAPPRSSRHVQQGRSRGTPLFRGTGDRTEAIDRSGRGGLEQADERVCFVRCDAVTKTSA